MSSAESAERSVHSDSDATATACAEAGIIAAKGFAKGDEEHQLFAKTVVKRLQKLPSDQKQFCIGMFQHADYTRCAKLDSLKATFEEKEAEARESSSKKRSKKLILVEWDAYYSKYSNYIHHHRVTFCL